MEQRSTIFGNIIVGEPEHLEALRRLDDGALRDLFQFAADQGVSACNLDGTVFEIRRNSDYTYHLAPQSSSDHWL